MQVTGIPSALIARTAARYSANADDVQRFTAWAQDLGYQGKKPLVVRDGHIVNHGHVEWLDFCAGLRNRNPNPIVH
jgi:hypothetical protein